MVEKSRREMIKQIAKGAIYAAPVVHTVAAPVRLLAQGPSSMMMDFCDQFPVLCMIFGDAAVDPAVPARFDPASGGPATPPAIGTPPWTAPPPGRR